MRRFAPSFTNEFGRTTLLQKMLVCMIAVLVACALSSALGSFDRAYADEGSADKDAAALIEENDEAASAVDEPDDEADQAEVAASDTEAAEDDEAAAPSTEEEATPADEGADAQVEGEGDESPAQIEEGTYVIASELGTVLDADGAGTSNGTNIQTYKDNSTAAQRYRITATGQDSAGEWYYTIENVNAGKVLDVDSASKKDGANVQLYKSNGTDAQKWYIRLSIEKSGKQYYTIIGVGSNKALDVYSASKANGANVQIYKANGTAAQNWLLNLCTSTVADGAYTIKSAINNNYVIDINSASGSDSARAQLYKANDTLAQTFAINYDEYSGYYVVTSYNSGKVLDVKAASGASGTPIQQYGANSTKAQWWKIVENSDGTVTFLSAINGYAIDVPSASAKNGNGLQTYVSNGTNAQKFKLVATTPELTSKVVRIQNGTSTNLVMDVPSGSVTAGAKIQLYASNSTFAQKFILEANDDGTYYVRMAGSGLYLSADESNNVTQQEKDSSYLQNWKIAATDNGHFTLVAVGGNALGAKSLTSTGVLSTAKNAKGTVWNFVPVALLSEGLYTISLASNSNIVLDIDGASLNNCANVQLYTGNNTNAQKFYIQANSDGTYTIRNGYSLRALDVADAKAQAGRNIWQYTANYTNAQKWTIEWEDGAFVFKSALGDFSMSAKSAASGANVELAAYDKTDDLQRFQLKSTTMNKLTTAQIISIVDQYSKGNALVVWGNIKSISSSTMQALNKAIAAIHNAGKSVGFTLIDLTTGAGISYNSEVVYASACSIKGPYTIALNQYVPSSLSAYRSQMYSALDVSNNETYCEYFYDYGRWPLERYNSIAHVQNFSWTGWTGRYTAEDLARMWVVSADYLLNSNTSNASWLKDVLSNNSATMSRVGVRGYGVSTVYAKSGWTDYSRTEGALVMAGDHPYVTGIMTTGNLNTSGLISDLAAALYRVHSELVY